MRLESNMNQNPVLWPVCFAGVTLPDWRGRSPLAFDGSVSTPHSGFLAPQRKQSLRRAKLLQSHFSQTQSSENGTAAKMVYSLNGVNWVKFK